MIILNVLVGQLDLTKPDLPTKRTLISSFKIYIEKDYVINIFFKKMLINDPAHHHPCFPVCVLAGKVFCTPETNMSQVCVHLPPDLNTDSSTSMHNHYHALWDPSRHFGFTVSSQQRYG